MVEIIEAYQCPLCSSKYINEGEADECLNDCWAERMTENTQRCEMYICEICDFEYEDLHECEECEHKHKQKNDMVYQSYLDKKEKEKLQKEAQHPQQKKLI